MSAQQPVLQEAIPSTAQPKTDPTSRVLELVEYPDWKHMLLDLVRSEELDPNAIDVGRLAQLFLDRIRTLRENNLYVPANALLACAILLSMKADHVYYQILPLAQQTSDSNSSEDFDSEDDLLLDAAFLSDPDAELTTPIQDELDSAPHSEAGGLSEPPLRVLPPARITTRKVSLEELLSAVERVMRAKKSVSPRKTVAEPPIIEEFFEDLDATDVERYVERVHGKVLELAATDAEGIVTFSQLVSAVADGAPAPEDHVNTFLSLLYLANDGKINLWQEEPFDEVFIALLDSESSRALDSSDGADVPEPSDASRVLSDAVSEEEHSLRTGDAA